MVDHSKGSTHPKAAAVLWGGAASPGIKTFNGPRAKLKPF